MPTSIAEYAGFANPRASAESFPYPQEPALRVTLVSSGGSSDAKSTVTFSANTSIVLISGQVNFWGLFGTSLFSNATNGGTSTVSSTSAQVLAPNMMHIRGVTPSSKLIGWST